MCFQCPDCESWASLGGNAAFHSTQEKHGLPTLVPIIPSPDQSTAQLQQRVRELEAQHESDKQAILDVMSLSNELADKQNAERDALKAQLDEAEKRLEKEVGEKEDAEQWADRIASAFTPFSILGDHSNMSNPWENAVDFAEQLLHEAFRCRCCKEQLSSVENDRGADVCGQCNAHIAEASE